VGAFGVFALEGFGVVLAFMVVHSLIMAMLNVSTAPLTVRLQAHFVNRGEPRPPHTTPYPRVQPP
jgi:hypothetical protein